MKTRLLLLLTLILALGVCRQVQAQARWQMSTHHVDTAASLRAGYVSTLLYPGMQAGLELPRSYIEIHRRKKYGKSKTVYKDRLITANLAWYHHQNFHTNLMLGAGYTLRRTNASGWFTAFEPQLGVSRTFLAGTTYRVSESGVVSRKTGAGYGYLYTNLGIAIGKQAGNIAGKPLKLYVKPSLITLLPYNGFVYVRPMIELGVIYPIPVFLQTKTKVNVKHKTANQ
jgi:hypothetical protein